MPIKKLFVLKIKYKLVTQHQNNYHKQFMNILKHNKHLILNKIQNQFFY